MNDEASESAQPKRGDRAATILTVVGALFLVGHVTALFPHGPASGWASAAAFTGLLFVYASYAGPGRRSDLAIFLAAGLIALLAFLLWFAMMLNIDERGWYYATFKNFELGLSSRGWGAHGGLVWLVLWSISILLLIVLAVTLRNLAARLSARI